MMKKVLVLLLIFGLASAASAALVSRTQGSMFRMDVDGPTTIPDVGDTLTVSIYAGSDVGVGAMLSTVLNISKASAVGTVTQGTPANWSAYAGTTSTSGSGYNVNVNGVISTTIPTNSLVYSVTFTAVAGLVTIDATSGTWDTYVAVVGKGDGFQPDYGDLYGLPYAEITVAPEPMTVALLGLGGLFLRRRK